VSQQPIKTLILNAVKTDIISVIGDANRVYIDPSRGLREETTEPYTNIFTSSEAAHKKDLYSEKILDIEIHTWVKEDTDDKAREKAQLIDAQIQEKILPRASLARQYCWYFEQSESACSDILYYSEGLCVVVSRYTLKYRHTYNNPFQLNP